MNCAKWMEGPKATEEHHVPFTEILYTLRREDIVVPLPRKLGLDETFRGETLHGLDNLQVGNVEFLMLRRVIVLFGYEDTLCNGMKV